MCANKDTTLEVFGKLGRETGVKEFNALMRLCVDKARKTPDDQVILRQIYKAYKVLEIMKEQGFPVKEVTYGPLLVYLLALSESDRKDEVLLLLKSIDITNVSSVNHISNIFRTLGRYMLESTAKTFLQALKVHGVETEKISNYIYNYAISMPNLVVGDIVLNINNMHTELEVVH
ncbi:hypothetical protein POM88_031502 [Heracleum sosnowskyi]|uniref:Pentatricopeptide repeat-containing protein n=1 Tax=Heracleum sosnowskyi TaxID=360622 RepID=A0AAD8HXK0_9APIA|nr:hypothetical protein POM88_031502 [Heracleum sosnowskyi]